MKSRFFSKKDEVILSTVTALIVVGLVWQGLLSLWDIKSHAVFHRDSSCIARK